MLSRRDLLLTTTALSTIKASCAQTRAQINDSLPTAAQIVAKIQEQVGIPWREKTVDKIVGGTSDTSVHGIATTMMATLDVLERAAAANRNMVITHETPFYLHQDDTADLQDDPTFQYKQKFIRDHNLAVFHFHDHWHARKPDGIAFGMMRQLQWTPYADASDPRRFTFNGTPLKTLAHQVQTRLSANTVRVIGDPDLPIRQAFASWGFVSRMPGIPQFREPGLDLFLAGETREWELVEYVQDSIAKGDRKAMIVIGHVASEQAGMKYCAEWLRGFIQEVPIEFIAAKEPFWSPSK